MRRATDPLLWIQTAPSKKIALVRGDEAKRITHLVSRESPRWSGTGRGWVVPLDVVDDLRCYAWCVKDFVIVFTRER